MDKLSEIQIQLAFFEEGKGVFTLMGLGIMEWRITNSTFLCISLRRGFLKLLLNFPYFLRRRLCTLYSRFLHMQFVKLHASSILPRVRSHIKHIYRRYRYLLSSIQVNCFIFVSILGSYASLGENTTLFDGIFCFYHRYPRRRHDFVRSLPLLLLFVKQPSGLLV